LHLHEIRNPKALGTSHKISKLSSEELQISYKQILLKLNFINEEIIPEKIWLISEKITQNIDVDDSDFVALTKYLKATLWTGDKTLQNGLKKNGFKKVLNTSELLALRTTKIEK